MLKAIAVTSKMIGQIKIATNYSKGISLIGNLKESESSVDFYEKNAPSEIQELFSRNELIQKFADKKYLLNSLELGNLIGEENHLNIKQYLLFEWRNWRLIPKDKKYWICLLYTSPSPRDLSTSRMPSSA